MRLRGIVLVPRRLQNLASQAANMCSLAYVQFHSSDFSQVVISSLKETPTGTLSLKSMQWSGLLEIFLACKIWVIHKTKKSTNNYFSAYQTVRFSNIHFHKHSTTMTSLNAISYYGSNNYKKIDIYNLPEGLHSSTIQNLISFMWRYKSSS